MARASEQILKRQSTETVSLVVAGVGCGIDELSERLNNNTVSWAMCRFNIGSGTFARVKIVTVTCNRKDTATVHRGRLQSRTPEALSLFEPYHVHVQVESREELTLDFMLNELEDVCVADHMGEFSLDELRADYKKANKEARSARAKLEEERSEKVPAPPADDAALPEDIKLKRKLSVSVPAALQALGAPSGRFNWVLLSPTMELHNAGNMGLNELKESLDPEKVLFGTLRLTFPRGRDAPPIVKNLFIHWIGPSVSAVKRAQLSTKLEQAMNMFREVSILTFNKTAYTLDDLDIAELIAELERVTYDTDSLARKISVEWYEEGLGAEIKQIAEHEEDLLDAEGMVCPHEGREEHKVSRSPRCTADLPDIETAVSIVRQPYGAFNWMLLECDL